MTDYTSGIPPVWPVDALRDALGRADLEAASALLDAHDRAVRQTLTEQDASLLDPRQVQAWQQLAMNHHEFMEELAKLRDLAGDQLQQLQRHQRGASAYLQAMG